MRNQRRAGRDHLGDTEREHCPRPLEPPGLENTCQMLWSQYAVPQIKWWVQNLPGQREFGQIFALNSRSASTSKLATVFLCFRYIFVVYVQGLCLLCTCMYTSCLPNVHRGQKRMLDPQELELWMTIDHLGPENQIQVYCKSRKCCWLLAEPSLQPHAGFSCLFGWLVWGFGVFFSTQGVDLQVEEFASHLPWGSWVC